jgi:hypothetical protein
MPLTGQAITDPAAGGRMALVVKVDDNPAAHPQAGLNQADIVFEEIVEQNTRFAAVFQSRGSDPVGPIRSGRTQDVLIFGAFNHPLFAWSGGNAFVTNAIAQSDLVDLNAQHGDAYRGGGYFRQSGRSSPHNLFAQTTGLWSLAPAGSGPPPQQFAYRADGQAVAGQPSPGLDVTMDALKVGWTWDAASGHYLRTENGRSHEDANGDQVGAANVVVLTVDYQPSAADFHSPEAQTNGTGPAQVFSGGNVVAGTWTRADRTSTFTLTAEDGTPIRLTPGNTWIELAQPDTSTPRTP